METAATGGAADPAHPQVLPAAPWLRRFPLRTPTLPPATHTNVYLIGEGDLLVVDPASPYPEEQRRLMDALAALAQAGHRARALLLTHHHGDHVGGAAALRAALGLPLWAHAETDRRVAQRVGGPAERVIADGEVLPFGPGGLRALHTPGHAPGHLCLQDLRGAGIIAGDMVASVGTILIDPEDQGDMAQYLDSLARLRDLAAGGALRLWPAHGVAVEDGAALCEAYVRHRLGREARVRAALEAGAGTEPELLRHAYADVPEDLWPLARRSLRAHLEKLQAEGQAAPRSDGGWTRLSCSTAG